MTAFKDLLEEALEAWSYTRSGVLDELQNLPEKDLGFRPNEEARSAASTASRTFRSMNGPSAIELPPGIFQFGSAYQA